MKFIISFKGLGGAVGGISHFFMVACLIYIQLMFEISSITCKLFVNSCHKIYLFDLKDLCENITKPAIFSPLPRVHASPFEDST